MKTQLSMVRFRLLLIMFNLHTSYYANYFYLCHTNFNSLIYMDKKLIYRKIRQLQLFRYAFCLSHHFSGSGNIYEITKLWYDTDKKLRKSIEYAYVKEDSQFPIYDGFDVFDIHVVRLNKKDVNRLVSECNSYSIDIDCFVPLNI